MIEINSIYNMDCLDGIEMMIKQGLLVDSIITDPPYGISQDNNFHTMGRAGIDFGDWDKNFNQFSWIDKAFKVLKNGGSLFTFNSWRNIGKIADYAESVGFEVKDMVRWVKTNPMPRNRDRRYIVDFELAIWLVKPKGKWIFNRLSDKYDRCEYRYPVTAKSERVGHKTQKPLALMEEIIKRHTNEGQLVLDPFIGSGTTALACKNLNRDYIGFELMENYYKLAKERVHEI